MEKRFAPLSVSSTAFVFKKNRRFGSRSYWGPGKAEKPQNAHVGQPPVNSNVTWVCEEIPAAAKDSLGAVEEWRNKAFKDHFENNIENLTLRRRMCRLGLCECFGTEVCLASAKPPIQMLFGFYNKRFIKLQYFLFCIRGAHRRLLFDGSSLAQTRGETLVIAA
jgi:hypothetical protein